MTFFDDFDLDQGQLGTLRWFFFSVSLEEGGGWMVFSQQKSPMYEESKSNL